MTHWGVKSAVRDQISGREVLCWCAVVSFKSIPEGTMLKLQAVFRFLNSEWSGL
jgi:hypothetical protein